MHRPAGRRRRWSLRTRLLVSSISLIALVCAVVGVVTAVALQQELYGQLDRQLVGVADRAQHLHPPGGGVPDGGGSPPDPLDFVIAGGQGIGTLGAVVVDGQVVEAKVSTLSAQHQPTGVKLTGDAQKAALSITDYRQAIDRVAQTTLRELIGSSMLSVLLSDRATADSRLRTEIEGKTAAWGISVSSVEIRDVAIPVALQDAMSRQAQAEREKQARVILGSAEAAIASNFVEAARVYESQPGALQLRAMNIIYETTKERGATILMPTSMVDSLNPALALAVAGRDIVTGRDALATPLKTAA